MSCINRTQRGCVQPEIYKQTKQGMLKVGNFYKH